MPYKKNKTKKNKRPWSSYLPLVFLIVLVCNGLIIFSQVSKTIHENAKVMPPERVPVQIGGREYNNLELTDNDYRHMARDLDEEILKAYSNSKIAQNKQARRERFVDYDEDPEMYMEERIRSMKDELARSFNDNETREKGTVGYELKKAIERMENEPQ